MSEPSNSTAANCPFCGIRFSLEGVGAVHTPIRFTREPRVERSADGNRIHYTITAHYCPDCGKPMMWLNEVEMRALDQEANMSTQLLWPKFPLRPLPQDIPEPYRRGASEAASVLELSPKASAALSRRYLQDVLRTEGGVKGRTLEVEVAAMIAKNVLPQYLAQDLDAIRHVGNFAAHPIKNTNTGEIVEVEQGEAEWTLELLESLLKFFFTDAKRSTTRRQALNEKLQASGKPTLPEPPTAPTNALE